MKVVFVEEMLSRGKAAGTGCFPYVRDPQRASQGHSEIWVCAQEWTSWAI